MTPEDEIKECYNRMGVPLAEAQSSILGGGFIALSQYGYTLADGFTTLAEAEAYAIGYYTDRMELIRQ